MNINNFLVDKFLKTNSVLLASINFAEAKVEVYDGTENHSLSYRGFFNFVADYYDLVPTFIDNAVKFFDNKILENEIKTIVEYKKKKGKTASFQYHFIKQNEFSYILFLTELKDYFDNSDKMTKADSVDSLIFKAKNCILTKKPFNLIYVDIDNFKYFNEAYGQQIGDLILIELVAACKQFMGENGAIARIGGDRFLILATISDNYNIVHEFLFNLKMAAQDLPTCVSKGIVITLTMGSARFPFDGNSFELLELKSKKALVRGKNKGRDCFIIYLEDKCGPVSINDKIEDKIVKNDIEITKNNVYSILTEINQLLSDDKTFDASLDKVLSLVGDFYYIDRVSVARTNVKTHKIMKHHVWHNPKVTNKFDVYCNDELVAPWGKALGTKNYITVDDSDDLDEDHPLKKLFRVDNTTSTMSYELMVNNKSFGIIRFDMTTGKRHWQFDVFQVFMLISQLISTALQKNYLRETNSKTLFFDPKYSCYNFTKFFQEVGDYLINNDITKFTIVELDIRNIISFRALIGEKRMIELTSNIISVFDKYEEVIYGKKNDGPFIAFFNHQDKDRINELIDKINTAVENFSDYNHFNDLSLQTGVYLADVSNERLIDAIGNANLTRNLNKTDKPLYYSEEIKAKEMLKNEMVLRIDEAIEDGEFLLYLQPKISTTDGTLIGAEALTRWKYKHEKLMFPDEFIPLFEQQGIVERLDYSVFENVCKYQNELIKEGKAPVPISVNVSRYVSDFDQYISTIEYIRNQYDIPADLIEIEITEGMYFENLTTISKFINNLHEYGYKVSMDDFGSGYSNLVSIAKLKFDTIKFDRSFCLDLDNENVKIMLDKLIELIKMMNMTTICEGVETKENVDYLTKIGCDSIQGYYYSKPIPYEDFKEKYYK